MPKVIAYCALHYGCDYLGYAIRSVIDHVDEMWILYSPHGSHGSQTTLPCPDSERDLEAIADKAAGKKLRWVTGDWRYENEQRESIYQFAPDADVILVVDSDEIWPETAIKAALGWYGVRYLRMPMVHFYRSFHSAVIHDPAYPVRVIFPTELTGETTQGRIYGHIAHMGYCQRSEVIRYKMHIHGHKGELRCSPDEYVDNYYLNLNRTHDLHPVGSEYWNPEPVNPMDYLPSYMALHPYFNLDLVP